MAKVSKTKGDMTMTEFFRSTHKIDAQNLKLVDYGFGNGKGPIIGIGTFSQYSKNIYKQKELGDVYLGKDIDDDTVPMSINNQTVQFDIGDTPFLLVNLNNIIREMSIKVKWMNADSNTVILESYYQIPSPSTKRLSWWDIYSSYFMGPKLERKGKYLVRLEIDNRRPRELSTGPIFSTEFTVSNSSKNMNANMNVSTSNSEANDR